MLVDLGRNDIGKISRFGSVQVEKYLSIERFSHVMHIGSTVRGELREDCDAVDAIDAILPGGHFVGSPQSCGRRRSSTSWNTTSGGCTAGPSATWTLPAIWTPASPSAWLSPKTGRCSSAPGAGIVADSEPEKEYQECINKAKAVVRALELAQKERDL